MNYLFFDCETGGLDHTKHDLLTAYFAIYDKNLNIIDDLYLQLKPSDGRYPNAEQAALDVTKINLEEHLADSNTVTYAEGSKKLVALLERHKIKGKRRHYRPAGHNIGFDRPFVWKYLLPEDEWRKTVHHNSLDTLRILTFLQDVGMLPPELGTLTSMVSYFNIQMGEAHNAREDIKMNVEVYKCLRNMLRSKKESLAGVDSNSLLQIVEM